MGRGRRSAARCSRDPQSRLFKAARDDRPQRIGHSSRSQPVTLLGKGRAERGVRALRAVVRFPATGGAGSARTGSGRSTPAGWTGRTARCAAGTATRPEPCGRRSPGRRCPAGRTPLTPQLRERLGHPGVDPAQVLAVAVRRVHRGDQRKHELPGRQQDSAASSTAAHQRNAVPPGAGRRTRRSARGRRPPNTMVGSAGS